MALAKTGIKKQATLDLMRCLLVVFTLAAVTGAPSGTYAQTLGSNNGGSVDKVLDEHQKDQEIISANKEIQQNKRIIAEQTNQFLTALGQNLKNAYIIISQHREARKGGEFSFTGDLEDLVNIHAGNTGSQDIVYTRLNEIARQATAGYKEVQNIESGGKTYNAAVEGNAAAIDRYYFDRYVELFCTKSSANTIKGCESTSIVTTYPNFHDFFLNERTWPDKNIFNVMMIARRFILRSGLRQSYGGGSEDVANVVESQGTQARANLRMAALHDLAAKRAPISGDASLALGIVLNMYASTGQVRSANLTELCKQTDKSEVENFICNMTSAPLDDKGNRLISQVVVDRTLQHDIYMSPDYYGSLQAAGFHVEGSLDKQEVFTKAQQVAQAYREIQLLQMKTVLYAMNVMGTQQ